MDKLAMNISKNKQNGAVLFICLVLLLIMSLTGINSMRTASLEEKMTGNIRSQEQSFQAAETALRIGEASLNAFALPAFDGLTLGHYQQDNTLALTIDFATQAIQVPGGTVAGVATQPYYFLEETTGTVDRDASGSGLGVGINYRAEETLTVYRVTALGIGGSTDSETILRTTYIR